MLTLQVSERSVKKCPQRSNPQTSIAKCNAIRSGRCVEKSASAANLFDDDVCLAIIPSCRTRSCPASVVLSVAPCTPRPHSSVGVVTPSAARPPLAVCPSASRSDTGWCGQCLAPGQCALGCHGTFPARVVCARCGPRPAEAGSTPRRWRRCAGESAAGARANRPRR